LLIDAKEIQYGHLQRSEHTDDEPCLELYPLKQKLRQIDPLTIHSADYYRIHEALAAIQAERLATRRWPPNTPIGDEAADTPGEKPRLKVVASTAERQAQPG
jgi:hypothetical protein